MELLGFVLTVLAIAFVVAKLIFSRKAQKTPKRDTEWEAYTRHEVNFPEQIALLRT